MFLYQLSVLISRLTCKSHITFPIWKILLCYVTSFILFYIFLYVCNVLKNKIIWIYTNNNNERTGIMDYSNWIAFIIIFLCIIIFVVKKLLFFVVDEFLFIFTFTTYIFRPFQFWKMFPVTVPPWILGMLLLQRSLYSFKRHISVFKRQNFLLTKTG